MTECIIDKKKGYVTGEDNDEFSDENGNLNGYHCVSNGNKAIAGYFNNGKLDTTKNHVERREYITGSTVYALRLNGEEYIVTVDISGEKTCKKIGDPTYNKPFPDKSFPDFFVQYVDGKKDIWDIDEQTLSNATNPSANPKKPTGLVKMLSGHYYDPLTDTYRDINDNSKLLNGFNYIEISNKDKNIEDKLYHSPDRIIGIYKNGKLDTTKNYIKFKDKMTIDLASRKSCREIECEVKCDGDTYKEVVNGSEYFLYKNGVKCTSLLTFPKILNDIMCDKDVSIFQTITEKALNDMEPEVPFKNPFKNKSITVPDNKACIATKTNKRTGKISKPEGITISTTIKTNKTNTTDTANTTATTNSNPISSNTTFYKPNDDVDEKFDNNTNNQPPQTGNGDKPKDNSYTPIAVVNDGNKTDNNQNNNNNQTNKEEKSYIPSGVLVGVGVGSGILTYILRNSKPAFIICIVVSGAGVISSGIYAFYVYNENKKINNNSSNNNLNNTKIKGNEQGKS